MPLFNASNLIRALCTSALLCIAAPVLASPLLGLDVKITSRLNGGALETAIVTVGAASGFGASPEITSSTASTFSWMVAGDFIDLYTNSNPVASDTFSVYLADSHNFSAADILEFTLDLPTNIYFGPIALTEAIDVQVPEASINSAGNQLYFKLANLDQIGTGFPGLATYKFQAVPTPEPMTVTLLGAALIGALAMRRRA